LREPIGHVVTHISPLFLLLSMTLSLYLITYRASSYSASYLLVTCPSQSRKPCGDEFTMIFAAFATNLKSDLTRFFLRNPCLTTKFGELRTGEVPRIPLPSTSLNKSVPNSSQIHRSLLKVLGVGGGKGPKRRFEHILSARTSYIAAVLFKVEA
jgi:hypothetical protein